MKKIFIFVIFILASISVSFTMDLNILGNIRDICWDCSSDSIISNNVRVKQYSTSEKDITVLIQVNPERYILGKSFYFYKNRLYKASIEISPSVADEYEIKKYLTEIYSSGYTANKKFTYVKKQNGKINDFIGIESASKIDIFEWNKDGVSIMLECFNMNVENLGYSSEKHYVVSYTNIEFAPIQKNNYVDLRKNITFLKKKSPDYNTSSPVIFPIVWFGVQSFSFMIVKEVLIGTSYLNPNVIDPKAHCIAATVLFSIFSIADWCHLGGGEAYYFNAVLLSGIFLGIYAFGGALETYYFNYYKNIQEYSNVFLANMSLNWSSGAVFFTSFLVNLIFLIVDGNYYYNNSLSSKKTRLSFDGQAFSMKF